MSDELRQGCPDPTFCQTILSRERTAREQAEREAETLRADICDEREARATAERERDALQRALVGVNAAWDRTAKELDRMSAHDGLMRHERAEAIKERDAARSERDTLRAEVAALTREVERLRGRWGSCATAESWTASPVRPAEPASSAEPAPSRPERSKTMCERTARREAEEIVEAYEADILTGSAPGLTLADLIEVAIERREKALRGDLKKLRRAAKMARSRIDEALGDTDCDDPNNPLLSACMGLSRAIERTDAALAAGKGGQS